MEVILKEDVAKLGSRGDMVKVAEGYGRNFLLPHRLAIEATSGNKKVIEQTEAVPGGHAVVRRRHDLRHVHGALRGGRAGLHELQHRPGVTGHGGLHGQILRGGDPVQVFAQVTGHGRSVARPQSLAPGYAHALHDHALGEILHLAGVREVDRQAAIRAGQQAFQ